MTGEPATPAPEPQPTEQRSYDILLVEDSLFNQKLAVGLLQKRNHRVTVANNGIEGIEALKRAEFDLVLMDIQMPELDGLEATRRIREQERKDGRHVPIIAMTAQAMIGDRERCLDAGMDGYVVKPIHAKQLYETMDAVLSDQPAPDEPVRTVSVETHRVVMASALQAVNGDHDLLKQIFAAFLEECPMLVKNIETALGAGDARACQMAAHTLKGAVRTFGAETASRLAGEIEAAGKAGDLGTAQANWPQLAQEIEAIRHELAGQQ